MGDDGAFFGKAFYVLGFFFEIAYGNKEREVGILVSRVLKHLVHDTLDIFPEGVSPGFDDHATADGRVFGEVGGAYDLLVPLGVVFCSGWRNGGFGWFR